MNTVENNQWVSLQKSMSAIDKTMRAQRVQSCLIMFNNMKYKSPEQIKLYQQLEGALKKHFPCNQAIDEILDEIFETQQFPINSFNPWK